MSESVQTTGCGTFVPCAGTIAEGSALLISMPCQLEAGHDGDHALTLNTDEYDVVITATERRRVA